MADTKVSSKPAEKPSRPASKAPARNAKAETPKKTESAAPKDRASISQAAREESAPASKPSAQIEALKDTYGARTLRDEKSDTCIDRAAAMARNEDQALFLRDSQNKDKNDAGHVVLQRDGQIIDPSTPDKRYADFEAYKHANPQYAEILGQTSGENLKNIVDAATPADREAAIQQAGLEKLAGERFADVPQLSSDFWYSYGQYNSNQRKMRDSNEKLGRQLDPVQHALSPEEQKKFIDEHRAKQPAHKELEADLKGMKAGLLEQSEPQEVLKALQGKNAEARNAFLALAGSDHARDLSDWVKAHGTDLPQEFKNQLAERALPQITRQLLDQANERGPGGSLENIAPLKDYLDLYDKKGDATEAWESLQDASKFRTADEYGKWMKGVNERTPDGFGRGLAAAGMLIGAANAYKDANNGEWTKMFSDVAKTGEGAATIISGLKAASSAPAQTAGKWAGRLAPGLGAASSLLSAADNIDKLASGTGNAGNAISLTGDAISAMGSIISCIPPAAPVGGAVNLVGTTISALGSITSSVIDERAIRSDRLERLQSLGIDQQQAQILMSDPVRQAAQDHNLSPSEVRAYASGAYGWLGAQGTSAVSEMAGDAMGRGAEIPSFPELADHLCYMDVDQRQALIEGYHAAGMRDLDQGGARRDWLRRNHADVFEFIYGA